MNTPIRIFLCDDHAIVRKGFAAMLTTQPDILVVGEAADGAQAVAQTDALKPDVVLMDLMMPQLDGIGATQQITARHPNVHVLVLTSFAADD